MRGQRGAVLLGTVLVVLTLSLIGATLAVTFSAVSTEADVQLARMQAFYLAEAGIADAVHHLRNAHGVTESTQENPEIPLGAGTYLITHDLASGVITSTGQVRGVKRTIQIKYYPF